MSIRTTRPAPTLSTRNYIGYMLIACLVLSLFLLPPALNATQTARANLNIIVDLDPVFPDSSNRCGGITPAWFFKLTLVETGGVGFNITKYSVSFYDNNLDLINTIDRTANEFASFFDDCGGPSARIQANSQVCGFQCVHMGGRRSGTVVFAFFGRGDNDTLDRCFSKQITLRASDQDADLSATIISSTFGVASGSKLLYTVRVLNNGPKTATGVTLNASTPAGTTFSSIGLSQGSSTTPPAGGTGAITCFLDSIGPDSEVVVSLIVNVTATAGSTLGSTVSVTSTSIDPNPENNTASDRTSVLAFGGGALIQADLSVATASSSGTITAGTRLAYNITVRNSGPDMGGGTFVIPLPAGTTFSSVATNNSSCQSPAVGVGGALVCGTAILPVNGTAVVTVTVNVLTTPGSPLSNKAELIEGSVTRKTIVTCSGVPLALIGSIDPNSNNNSGVSTALVQGGRIVSLAWQQPTMMPASAEVARNAAPVLTRVSPASTTQEADVEAEAASIAPEESGFCTLNLVLIYKSDQPDVQPIPANLWKIVSPDKVQTTMAAAPAGSFFRLVNLWRCGNMTVESEPSNERNSAGALVPFIVGTPVKQGKALIVTGESFSSGAKLLINGQQQKTAVESSSRLFCKKAGKKVRSGDRLRVLNPDGGLSPEIIYP